VETGGELAELGDCELKLSDRALEHPNDVAVEQTTQTLLRGPELQSERDEALLRTVVEVALDAPALLVAGTDDPRARLLDADDLLLELCLEARVLEREPRGRNAASISSGSSRRLASCTNAASGSPPWSSFVTARRGPSSGSVTGRPSSSTYVPRSGSQNAISRDGSSTARASAVRSSRGGTRSSSRSRSATFALESRDESSPARNATGSAIWPTTCHQ
jgi:hypothetical protein